MNSRAFRLLLALALPALAACDGRQVASATGVILQTAEQILSESPAPLPQPGHSPSAAPTARPTLPPSATGFEIEEGHLFDLLMAYRAEHGLPAIPRSPSLTTVARAHVADLAAHPPDRDACNLHSWSSNGPWTAVCYTSDHAEAAKMWSKPRELTSYQGNGYEIAYYATTCTPQGAIDGWKGSAGHDAVMINAGKWSDSEWKAAGVGINDHYAVIWFGEEAE